MAQLPSVTQSEYEQRVAAKAAQTNAAAVVFHCATCRRAFKSANMLESHNKSKKHAFALKEKEKDEHSKKDSAVAASDADKKESMAIDNDGENATVTTDEQAAAAPKKKTLSQMSDEELAALSDEQLIELKMAAGVQLEPTDCLFCTRGKFADVSACLEHMAAEHSFYIPDMQYIADIGAFLQFLGQKVGVGNACVNCSRGFASLDAVRAHMLATSHSKLQLGAEESEELSDFYDFSTEPGSVAAAAAAAAAGATSTELVAASAPRQRTLVEVNGYIARFDDGRVIGHRSLVAYYKQNVQTANPSEAALLRAQVSSVYRRIGKSYDDLPKLDTKARIYQKQARLYRDKQSQQVSVKANKLFKLKPQVMEC